MLLGRLVEGRGNDLAVDRALHVGDFLGPLVDQQDDQEHLGVVRGDRVGQRLEQHRLAGTRRGDDQATLALADRRQQIHDPAGEVVRVTLELQRLLGVQRRQVVEEQPLAQPLRVVEGDRQDLDQGEVVLVGLGGTHLARDGVAGGQSEALDLGRRDVDVVGTRQVVVVGVPQEAVAVLQDLQHALGEHEAALFGLGLHDLEDQLLLAHGGRLFDAQRLGRLGQRLGAHLVERVEIDRLLLGDLLDGGSARVVLVVVVSPVAGDRRVGGDRFGRGVGRRFRRGFRSRFGHDRGFAVGQVGRFLGDRRRRRGLLARRAAVAALLRRGAATAPATVTAGGGTAASGTSAFLGHGVSFLPVSPRSCRREISSEPGGRYSQVGFPCRGEKVKRGFAAAQGRGVPVGPKTIPRKIAGKLRKWPGEVFLPGSQESSGRRGGGRVGPGELLAQPAQSLEIVHVEPAGQLLQRDPGSPSLFSRRRGDTRSAPGDLPQELRSGFRQADQDVAAVLGRRDDGLGAGRQPEERLVDPFGRQGRRVRADDHRRRAAGSVTVVERTLQAPAEVALALQARLHTGHGDPFTVGSVGQRQVEPQLELPIRSGGGPGRQGAAVFEERPVEAQRVRRAQRWYQPGLHLSLARGAGEQNQAFHRRSIL